MKSAKREHAWSLIWLLTVGAAFVFLLRYEQVQGLPASPPATWPSALPLGANYTLIAFLHPQCPCSRATVTELTVFSERHKNIRKYVAFLQPHGFSDNWVHSDLWERLNNLPQTQLIADKEGKLSGLFKATTSGQILLYDTKGELRFSGGITSARGHEGDNCGLDALDEIVSNKQATTRSTPVFGCSLSEGDRPNDEVLRACRN